MKGLIRELEGGSFTCRRSSKSRAASCFISERFVEKRLMVSLPNVGIARNLKCHQIIKSAGTPRKLTDDPIHLLEPCLQKTGFSKDE